MGVEIGCVPLGAGECEESISRGGRERGRGALDAAMEIPTAAYLVPQHLPSATKQ